MSEIVLILVYLLCFEVYSRFNMLEFRYEAKQIHIIKAAIGSALVVFGTSTTGNLYLIGFKFMIFFFLLLNIRED